MKRLHCRKIALCSLASASLACTFVTGCADPKVADMYEVRRDHQQWVMRLSDDREVRCENNLNDLALKLEKARDHHRTELHRTLDLINRSYQQDVQTWPDVTREAAKRFDQAAEGDPANIEYTVPLMFY